MGRDGRDLEKLVAVLERLLAGSDIQIEAPFRTVDRRTGTLREHDIALHTKVGHHPITIAIECRDRSRPVGVPQIEAFFQKCQDTGIAKGVVVSSAGFCRSGRKKASSFGIRCLDLREVDTFNWLAMTFPVFKTSMKNVQVTFLVAEPEVSTATMNKLMGPDGKEISNIQLMQFIYFALVQEVAAFRETTLEVPFEFDLEGVTALSEEKILTVNRMRGVAVFETIATLETYQCFTYEDQDEDSHLAQAAVAKLDHGPAKGRLIVTLDKKRVVRATFIPSNPDISGQP